MSVRLTDLDRAAREAGAGSLPALLAALSGPPLRDRRAERERLAAGVAACLARLNDSFLAPFPWFERWVAGLRADGTLTRLVDAGDTDPVVLAVAVLEAMDGREAPVLLPALAAEVTGDAKALAGGTVLSALVLRALVLRALVLRALVLRALVLRLGVPGPAGAADRRDLWDQFDVILEDLASRVLVLACMPRATGWPVAHGVARRGTPFYATLQQLITLPVQVSEPAVYVCENPAVLRAAAGVLGSLSLPLICTEGRPSTAFHRLAAAVTEGGGELRYHGDFDWPGISIAAAVVDRHAASSWRMTAADYLAGARVAGDGARPLSGAPQPTPGTRPWPRSCGGPAASSARSPSPTPCYQTCRDRRDRGSPVPE